MKSEKHDDNERKKIKLGAMGKKERGEAAAHDSKELLKNIVQSHDLDEIVGGALSSALKKASRIAIDKRDGEVGRYFAQMARVHGAYVLAAEVSDIKSEIRKAVRFNIRYKVMIYEGMVTDIMKSRDGENEITGIEMTLKSNKGSVGITLDKYMQNAIKNVNIGDVVYIEPAAGIMKRLGRSESCMTEYDLEGDKYVALGKNPVKMIKDRENAYSLYDFDYAFNQYSGEIYECTRTAVDEAVGMYVSNGNAVFLSSVLVLDSVERLAESQAAVLARELGKYPQLKVVLIGDLDNLANRARYKGFLRFTGAISSRRGEQLRDDEVKDDGLRAEINSYLETYGAKKVREILRMTETPEDFKVLISMQPKM